MSYSQLINLLLILGLISYTYGYNRENNYIRRRIRNADFKADAQGIINKVFIDQEELNTRTKDAIRQDEDAIKTVIEKIMLASERMAEAGATKTASAEQWTTIQGELRTGLNLIMDAYRRYIEVHRQICESIENYAKSMITKYESELSALDRLTVPTTPGGGFDTNNPAFMDWFYKMFHMMTYANVHQRTLPTALDCVHDLTRRELEQQQIIMSPPVSRVTIRVVHQAEPQNPVQNYDLPCNAPSEYNGCQSCSNAVAALTQRYATFSCPGQCPSSQQDQIYQ